jgi:hypothetical protein
LPIAWIPLEPTEFAVLLFAIVVCTFQLVVVRPLFDVSDTEHRPTPAAGDDDAVPVAAIVSFS